MKERFFALFLLLSLSSFSQIFGDEEFEISNFQNWNAESIKEYAGSYSFGFSDSESELRIFITNDFVCAQLFQNEWNENQVGPIPTFKNFNNVKIIGNKFYSDTSNGTFVHFKKETGQSVGLIIDKPWSGWIDDEQSEFGQRYPDKKPYLSGSYPECSQKIVSYNDIQEFDLHKLKIMRNEIFARYGYKFKKNEDMERHFSKLKWYSPFYDDVNLFLTEIEKTNIELIRKVEKSKSGL